MFGFVLWHISGAKRLCNNRNGTGTHHDRAWWVYFLLGIKPLKWGVLRHLWTSCFYRIYTELFICVLFYLVLRCLNYGDRILDVAQRRHNMHRRTIVWNPGDSELNEIVCRICKEFIKWR